MVCERLSSQNGFKENQGRIGHPLIDFLSQKTPQWRLDGLKTSTVVGNELLKYLYDLIEGKVKDRSGNPKIKVKFDEFNEYYKYFMSPYSKIRSFLDDRSFVGSLSEFKLFNIEIGDTDACACKRSWNLNSGRSVFAMSADYSVGGGKKREVVSFFDLYLCSLSEGKVIKPKMTVFDYVEIPLELEKRLVQPAEENYLAQRMYFYTGRDFLNKNQRTIKVK